jgi:alanyl-tRNA synthetase
LKEVEDYVNKAIEANAKVVLEEMDKNIAKEN